MNNLENFSGGELSNTETAEVVQPITLVGHFIQGGTCNQDLKNTSCIPSSNRQDQQRSCACRYCIGQSGGSNCTTGFSSMA